MPPNARAPQQQDFKKPFDATAILIVGQQTGGKSALIEALMGFQFNQVGGGTKTRRPIALRMQYNPRCSQPHCFLTLDNGKEEPRSLKEIQAYIEGENKRLENDELRCFDPREIMVRVEVRRVRQSKGLVGCTDRGGLGWAGLGFADVGVWGGGGGGLN